MRPTYVYGPNMLNNTFLPIIISQAKTEKKIILFGNGKRLQDYLHVDDLASLCVAASKFDGNDIFLGATGRSMSNLEIVNIIKDYIPDLRIIFKGEDNSPWFQFDPSKTKKVLRWDNKEQMNDCIKKMLGK